MTNLEKIQEKTMDARVELVTALRESGLDFDPVWWSVGIVCNIGQPKTPRKKLVDVGIVILNDHRHFLIMPPNIYPFRAESIADVLNYFKPSGVN